MWLECRWSVNISVFNWPLKCWFNQEILYDGNNNLLLEAMAGLRHVRGVRPNRAQTLGGCNFGPEKFRINYFANMNDWCLDYAADTDINAAFCEHTMQQNATVAGDLRRNPLGEKGREAERRGRERWERQGKGKESERKLEQGRQLANDSPVGGIQYSM